MRPSTSLFRPISVARVAMGTAVVSAGAVGALGFSGSAAAVPLGALLSGAIAMTGGAVIARRGLSGGRAVAFRVLLGMAAAVYGLGQVVLGVDVAGGGAAFPTPGDIVSTLSVPLAVLGLGLLPRRSGETRPGTRLALEAVMLGAAAAVLLWRLSFRAVILPELTAAELAAVVILLADLSVLALMLIAAVRELDRGLLLGLAGMALYVGADLATMHAVLQPGGTWPWYTAATACAAWPLIIVGLLRISTTPPHLPEASEPGAELRRTLVTAVTVCGLLVVYLLTLLADPSLDTVSVGLVLVLVLAYAGGEVVRAAQGKRLLGRLRTQARTDPLTDLPNRRALTEALDAGGTAHRSVLTLDLDGFKQVNSLLGHSAGDLLLVGVARQLRKVCTGAGATAFRLGGDEFAVVAETDLAGAQRLGSMLVDAVVGVRRDVPAAGAVDLTASVGVAGSADVGVSFDPLAALTASASALRVAKRTGRGSVVPYTSALAAEATRRALVEARLRGALRRGELEMHFQPVVDLATGAVTGLEALARWEDAELGRVSPEEFVPLAEQAGLVGEIGAYALRRGIEVLAGSGAAAAGVNLGVNASAVELRCSSYVDEAVRLLHHHAIAPSLLVLEVTESLFVAPDDPAITTLRALADIGVRIAVDDFGTGYSCLAYLHRLPVHVLKVDQSLTGELHDPRIRAVVGAVVDLGRALGLDVVVEGVETQETASRAWSLGARSGQGWLFSRAVTAAEVPALLGCTFEVAPEAAVGARPG